MPRLRPAKGEEDTKVDPKLATAEPEVELEAEPDIEVEVSEEPEVVQENDATVALRKQIEDLKKSTEIQLAQAYKDREDAIQRSLQREAQVVKVQKEAYDSQADAISSALAAAQAEADKAQLDIENAISLGDAKAQAEAQRRLSMAAANLTRLEEGKEAADARAKEPAPVNAGVDVIDTWGLPTISSDWCKSHRDWLSGDKLNAVRHFQDVATRSGLAAHTQKYLDFIEGRMNEYLSPPGEEVEPVVDEKPAPKKAVNVSAPPSRQVPNANGKRPDGKVTLTKAEQEAAKISGVSLEEYAKQKLKKQQMVESGEYGEQR